MKPFILLPLLALLAIASMGYAQEGTSDVVTTIDGIWSVEVTRTLKAADFETLEDTPVNVVANFSLRLGNLFGVLSSSDAQFHAQVQCVLEGPQSGTFYLLGGGAKDEEDEFEAGKALFRFDLRNTTSTGRVRVGSGIYHGSGASSASLLSKPGTYQISIFDNSVIVFNVLSADGSELVSLTASKVATDGEPSWYSKFSTPIIFLVAMSLSRVFRSYFKPAGQPEDPLNPQAGAARSPAAAKAKKD
jgi:hypothetical protein